MPVNSPHREALRTLREGPEVLVERPERKAGDLPVHPLRPPLRETLRSRRDSFLSRGSGSLIHRDHDCNIYRGRLALSR